MPRQSLRSIVFAAVAMFLTVSLAQADGADPWSVWGGNFDAVMSACVAASQNNCLSKAFTDRVRAPRSMAPRPPTISIAT